jgi:hypothetical protein
MLKLFDERTLAVAKQQNIPFFHELIHAPLAVDPGRGKPFNRQSRSISNSLNMNRIRLSRYSPQFPDQSMILIRTRRRVCSLLFPDCIISMSYHHGRLPLKDVFGGSSVSCILSDLKRYYGLSLPDLLQVLRVYDKIVSLITICNDELDVQDGVIQRSVDSV